tara:strand:- start:247 stop:432 length:186 start_codon:yes stop_codon:yes gene_type:complete
MELNGREIYSSFSSKKDIPMEGEPLDVVTQDQTRSHQQLSKVIHIDAIFQVLIKVDSRSLK